MLFEDLIRTTKLVEHYPFNLSIDFSIDDVVECSYMKGFFKVINLTPTYLTIVPLGFDASNIANHAYIGPAFLRKVQVNQEVMRILFDETD